MTCVIFLLAHLQSLINASVRRTKAWLMVDQQALFGPMSGPSLASPSSSLRWPKWLPWLRKPCILAHIPDTVHV